jgi:hypothetical protein
MSVENGELTKQINMLNQINEELKKAHNTV